MIMIGIIVEVIDETYLVDAKLPTALTLKRLKSKRCRAERTIAGFNLHASLPIGANDRARLERQLRYMGRPPLSEERLTKTAQGKIVVKLKKNWSDGTSHIVLTPMEFMARLVALIPPPRKNQIRYFGMGAECKARKSNP